VPIMNCVMEIPSFVLRIITLCYGGLRETPPQLAP
jgi:hypothetical protein